MLKAILPKRNQDSWGAGHYGASRGNRTHNGIDYECPPGSQICSLTSGIVTKLGYPYGDDLSFRYVEITGALGLRWRYFYVQPGVSMNDIVERGQVIGTSQSLDKRYRGITEHIHLEVKDGDNYLNPEAHHETANARRPE